MSLNTEERRALVNYRLQKARGTLNEARYNLEAKLWYSAANRLYYACYSAASALLIQNGYVARTHTGIIRLLGQHFVNTGLLDNEASKFYQYLFEVRQHSDYGDFVVIEESDVLPLVAPAETFINKMEELINNI